MSGFATALSSTQSSPLFSIFKTAQTLEVAAGTSITVESDAVAGYHAFMREGIIHVGLYDFPEHDCYTKLVGTRVVGVEANKFVYDTMAKPVEIFSLFFSFNRSNSAGV